MVIEIACPGCRFLLRADDEFAGESAPCPYCGAHIAVPGVALTEITDSIIHQGPAPDERVRRDSREAHDFPLERRLPIPQHGEPRPAEELEPDEDQPHGWDIPTSPRTLAVMKFLTMIACAVVYWGVALWHFEEQPFHSSSVGLCGVYFLVSGAMDLRARWPKRLWRDEVDDDANEPTSFDAEKPTFWAGCWSMFRSFLAIFLIYATAKGDIIVLLILPGWDLIIYLAVPPRYRQRLYLRSTIDVAGFLTQHQRDEWH